MARKHEYCLYCGVRLGCWQHKYCSKHGHIHTMKMKSAFGRSLSMQEAEHWYRTGR